MKLLENYANSISVPIKNKPQLLEKYFPLPDNVKKYITIQNSSGMPAKDYSWYSEVIELILPILQKENIHILQLGAKESTPLQGVINLCGQTNLGQCGFLLRNSLLHFGNDSWMCHYAGSIDIPLVALYGSTTIENHSPYHFNKDKTIFLESHRNGNRATFSREESPKTIDLIDPVNVAKSICKLLGLEFSYPYKTTYIGTYYNNRIVESACDTIIDVKKMGMEQLIMRMDLNYSLSVLDTQLSLCKCQIITNQDIPEQYLSKHRDKITDIIYKINKNHNPNFIKNIIKNKIKYQLISELNEDDLNSVKLSYLDYGIIFPIKLDLPDELKNKDLNKIYFKSSKLLLGRGYFYQTVYDYFINRNFNPKERNLQKIVDENIMIELIKESPFCMFSEKD